MTLTYEISEFGISETESWLYVAAHHAMQEQDALSPSVRGKIMLL